MESTIVEIDENERDWVGVGFGTRLLPSDRGHLTTTDGSMSWKTLSQVSEDLVLLGRGWKYEAAEFSQATEWMYAKDFRTESIKNAKPDRGMMHWVRFRRLYRTKLFNPDEFVPRSVSEKCEQADSSATDALSNLIVDTLTYCSMLHNPKNYTDAIALPLKERIINITIRQQPKDGDNSNPNSNDAFNHLDQIRMKLENFVEHESANTVLNRLLTSVDFTFQQRIGKEIFNKRKNIVQNRCFPSKESLAITTLIIKNIDPNFQLHCDKPNCGEICRFYRINCPNDGCSTVLSKLYLDEHNEQCPYKIIHCECGEFFLRHQLEIHNTQVCQIRRVDCPFKNIGCTIQVRACDLQSHLDEYASKHLLFTMNRMMEHQNVIKRLNDRVIALEGENKGLKQLLNNHVDKSMKDISQLGVKLNKTNKNLSNHEVACKKEFRKILR